MIHLRSYNYLEILLAVLLVLPLDYLICSKIFQEIPKKKIFFTKLLNAIPNLNIRHKGFFDRYRTRIISFCKKVIKGAINDGLIVDYTFSPQTLEWLPLIISYDELDLAAEILIKQLKSIL